jgi:hypothetical protein
MKKKLLIALGILSIIAASLAVGAYAASDIKLLINGKSVAADVQVIDGSSYVPLRVVSESLGAEVKWDGDARTISIEQNGSIAPVPKNPPKSFNVNVNVESGPMRMSISKVTLDPAFKKDNYSQPINAMILDVAAENTSTDTVSWHPNQGVVVLNTKEQADSSLWNSDDVGGEFIGKVIKSGKIVFEVKSDLLMISSVTYKVSGPSNSKAYTHLGEDKVTEIILK